MFFDPEVDIFLIYGETKKDFHFKMMSIRYLVTIEGNRVSFGPR